MVLFQLNVSLGSAQRIRKTLKCGCVCRAEEESEENLPIFGQNLK